MKIDIISIKTKPKKTLSQLFGKFNSISLEETNKKAKMLKRFDNKYVINRINFESFLEFLHEDFSILEIEGIREFSYSSCYYDDKKYQCYFDHQQGKRRRFKVRTREYLDSGLLFFEVKLKGLRGQTDKHRMSSPFFSAAEIKAKELELLTNAYETNYGKKYTYHLIPSLIVNYKRCTLVSKYGGERVTIDFRLDFSPFNDKSERVQIGDNFIIVETKSADGKGLADKVMKHLGIRQAEKCSKYCLGLNLTGLVSRCNDFLPMVRLISHNIISGKKRFKKSCYTPQTDRMIGYIR